jgi:hypothetical protein
MVALLKSTQLMKVKWQAMSVLWYGETNRLFKCKGVTVGNRENKRLQGSPSGDGWNSFKRQVLSYISRAHEVTGTFCFQEKTVKSRCAWVICSLADGTSSTKRFLSTRWCPSRLRHSTLTRKPWAVEIISMCLSYLQSRTWHAFNQAFSFNKMVSLQTENFYCHEKTVNSRNHLDVLELSAVSEMARLQPNLFF